MLFCLYSALYKANPPSQRRFGLQRYNYFLIPPNIKEEKALYKF